MLYFSPGRELKNRAPEGTRIYNGLPRSSRLRKTGIPYQGIRQLVPCTKRQRRILPLRQRMQERRRMRLRDRQVFADFDLPF